MIAAVTPPQPTKIKITIENNQLTSNVFIYPTIANQDSYSGKILVVIPDFTELQVILSWTSSVHLSKISDYHFDYSFSPRDMKHDLVCSQCLKKGGNRPISGSQNQFLASPIELEFHRLFPEFLHNRKRDCKGRTITQRTVIHCQ